MPAIVIEHVSEGRRNRKRDYEAKRGEYLQAGIAEYWIIDRFRRLMTVHRGPASHPTELVVRADEVYRTPLLPGFELPVSKLFGLIDELRRAHGGGEKP